MNIQSYPERTTKVVIQRHFRSISEEKMLDLENQLSFETAEDESALLVRNITYYQYEEVVRELENVKDELSRLKLGIESVLEEKIRAEKNFDASSSKTMSDLITTRSLKNELEEVKEERVLKELARMEALRELEAIEAERKKEFNKFSVALENTKRKMKHILEEIDNAKRIEEELSVTTNDVSILQIGLELAKESDKHVQRIESSRHSELDSPALLESITKELELAKNELVEIQGEAVQFMSSMDIIRNELIRIYQETARLKKAEEKTELRVQNMNSKLLTANKKLETLSLEEKKARFILSNLTLDLLQLRTETEASKKEKELICEEASKIEALIQKLDSEIESGEERLYEAMQELESVKSSELVMLENLKELIEDTVEARESAAQQSPSITISKFEHEYLTERANAADEIADKKVAAAQAWIEALKASEKEISMKIELAHKQKREMRAVEEQVQRTCTTEKAAVIEKISNLNPARRQRHRKSISLASRRSSLTTRRKRNESTVSAKLYDSNNIDMDP